MSSHEVTGSAKHILYDMPVSNNGARCRIILYKKGIPESEVAIKSPIELGGLKTPEYLALNPQGKMPLLTTNNINIPESDTICRYLMSEYKGIGPSFQPDNVKSNLIARIHDIYLTTIQGCLYKPSPPFGIYGTRADAITEYRNQLQIIDDIIGDDVLNNQYLCGSEISLADATLFPSLVFAKHMIPKFNVANGDKPLPPRIAQWYDKVMQTDEVFKKVHDEIMSGLDAWEERNRWDPIWLAGLRDDDPGTIFDKIVAREIPSTIVKEDSEILAFKDIAPAAPAHILVIPKDRANLSKIRMATPEHIEILGKLLVTAGEIAKDESLGFGDGARIVINDGPDGGQEVPHLHVHVLGGRKMTWPPG